LASQGRGSGRDQRGASDPDGVASHWHAEVAAVSKEWNDAVRRAAELVDETLLSSSGVVLGRKAVMKVAENMIARPSFELW
jgi:hypothetical protein